LGSITIMGMLSRVVRSGLVWAAALLTPVAGIPHVDCLCPDGHVKFFCLNFSSKSGPCCCGGACCSPDGGCCCAKRSSVHATQGKGKACCHQDRTHDTASGDRLAGTTCKKTLAEAATQTIPPATAAAHDHATVVALAAAPVPLLAPDADAGVSLLSWQSYGLPPPTDRVIAFQHLVI
jgi:hypothetical protein